MPTRRARLFVAACVLGMTCVAVAPAVAADASATAFVARIYDAYKGESSKGILLDTDAAIRRYFEPSLAALIIKDRKAAHGGVGTLDGDPFIDAQDHEISAVDIAVRELSPERALATVNFTNIDHPTTIVIDLIKIKSDWRIANITWQREGGKKETLRGLFRH